MNVVAYYRSRILAGMLAVSVLCFGYWWMTRYQPHQDILAQETALLGARNQRIRAARQQMVEMGVPEAEQTIARFREESARLVRRVPLAEEDGQSVSRMTEAMSAAASRFNVRLHAVQPLERQRDGEFNVEGYRAQVVGRYHDVGSFLTELLSFERITQLSAVRLDVVPDDVLAEAVRADGGNSERNGGQLGVLPVDPGLVREGVRLPEGEAPFNVSVVFTLNWFSSIGFDAVSPASGGEGPARELLNPGTNAF